MQFKLPLESKKMVYFSKTENLQTMPLHVFQGVQSECLRLPLVFLCSISPSYSAMCRTYFSERGL